MRFGYFPSNPAAEETGLEKKITRHSLLFAGSATLVLWLTKFLELSTNSNFVQGGVFPRAWYGLSGIVTSPLIHADFGHLISNSVPIFLLLFALIYYYRKYAYRILWMIYFFSGVCVWLFGREAWHIGASGVVYGLAAFHLTSGLLRNDVRLLTISVVVVFLYGGMVWGLFPIHPDVSWESHVYGAISGVVLAFAFRGYTVKRIPFDWENESDDSDENSTEPELEQNNSEEQSEELPHR